MFTALLVICFMLLYNLRCCLLLPNYRPAGARVNFDYWIISLVSFKAFICKLFCYKSMKLYNCYTFLYSLKSVL
jgi:hypothetical protein